MKQTRNFSRVVQRKARCEECTLSKTKALTAEWIELSIEQSRLKIKASSKP
jgi:hypothetical protein